MDAVSIGDLLSGGGMLTFAYVIWVEVKTMRGILSAMNERIALLEERSRTRCPVSATPPHGLTVIRAAIEQE